MEKYTGLDEIELAQLQQKYGPNMIEIKTKSNLVKKVLGYFKSPIILSLLFASSLSAFLGEIRDALIIVVMVFLSIILDFIQEYRANNAAEKLSQKLARLTTAIRNGEKKEVDVSSLVPEDIIF
jgi:Mg2+-importing ATPase